MIHLKYPPKTAALKEIKEQLKELSLAFKSVEDPSLITPTLLDGKKVISGFENIKSYIDQLVQEVIASRNHAC